MALIETRDLRRIYHLDAGRVVALDGVSLDIDKGDFVAVMGPSGSGKSTFMNLIGCLDKPTSGQYRLAGTEVEALNADGLARLRNREIGFVFQQFNLLPRIDALSNVELPMVYAGTDRKTRRERALHALDSRTANEILSLFQELNREGVTIVLVTHDAEVGRHARRLVRFKDGKVIEDHRQEPVDARRELAEEIAR
jgi:putative ABC transport system ATP-binding protein